MTWQTGEDLDLEHLVAIRATLAGSATSPDPDPARGRRRCGRSTGGLGKCPDHPGSRVRRAARAPRHFRRTVLSSGFRRAEGRRRGTHPGAGLVEPVADRESVERVEMPARHRRFSPVAMVARLRASRRPALRRGGLLEYEPAYNDDRMAQGHALADLATDPALDGPLPIIVAGDLNAAPTSPVLRPLCDVLTDAWSAGSGEAAAVTLPSSHPSAPVEAKELIDQRIDHIFYRPGQWAQRVSVESAYLAGAAVDGIYPSDHRAVVCQLSWREGS